MIIVDREDPNKIDFRQIMKGQAFRYKECVYMAIGNVLTLDDDDCEEEYNAVCLRNGALEYLCDNDKIEPLYDAQLILYPNK